jgi:hypothetical protein
MLICRHFDVVSTVTPWRCLSLPSRAYGRRDAAVAGLRASGRCRRGLTGVGTPSPRRPNKPISIHGPPLPPTARFQDPGLRTGSSIPSSSVHCGDMWTRTRGAGRDPARTTPSPTSFRCDGSRRPARNWRSPSSAKSVVLPRAVARRRRSRLVERFRIHIGVRVVAATSSDSSKRSEYQDSRYRARYSPISDHLGFLRT